MQSDLGWHPTYLERYEERHIYTALPRLGLLLAWCSVFVLAQHSTTRHSTRLGLCLFGAGRSFVRTLHGVGDLEEDIDSLVVLAVFSPQPEPHADNIVETPNVQDIAGFADDILLMARENIVIAADEYTKRHLAEQQLH
jgi:hypothetical protein